jgi:hypothetical protein
MNTVFSPERLLTRLPLTLLAAAALSMTGSRAHCATVTQNATDAYGTSSFNSGLHWSNGQAPSPANDYVNFQYGLRTPPVAADFAFGGASLTLGNGSTAASLGYKGIGSRTITINNLNLNNATIGEGGAGGVTMTLAGSVNLLSGGGTFDQAVANGAIRVVAAVSGSGTLRIVNTGTSAATTVGTTLAAANSHGGGTWNLWGQ